MKRIVKLTEKDLTRLIKRVIKEQDDDSLDSFEHHNSTWNESSNELKNILTQLNSLGEHFGIIYAGVSDTLDETDEDSEDYEKLDFLRTVNGYYYREIERFIKRITQIEKYYEEGF